jgi:cytochrome c oxidase assembly protein subunit 15
VRATAVFGLGLAFVVAWLVRHRNGNVRYAVPILAILLVQMAVGEIQYRNKLPWGLVLVHVTLASLLWASVVAFTATLMRPSRMAR